MQETASSILGLFPDPLDCLTAHLISEVLAEVKPANLISLVNRIRPCGRNLYQLWVQYQQPINSRLRNLEFIALRSSTKATLLLCYNRQQLEQHLSHAGIRRLLQKAGYNQDDGLDALLVMLKQRCNKNDCFPHEIGLFIGYPAKDVAAFMGFIKLPFACQALWKIYGNPVQSLSLAENFRCYRQRMGLILASGNQELLDIEQPEHPFFCQHNDIDFQIRNKVNESIVPVCVGMDRMQ